MGEFRDDIQQIQQKTLYVNMHLPIFCRNLIYIWVCKGHKNACMSDDLEN